MSERNPRNGLRSSVTVFINAETAGDPGPPDPPAETFNILLESGDAMLLESGDNILKEDAT